MFDDAFLYYTVRGFGGSRVLRFSGSGSHQARSSARPLVHGLWRPGRYEVAGRGLARRAVEAARNTDPERERSEPCAAGCGCAGVDLRHTPAGGRYVRVLIGEPCPPRRSEGHRAGASVPGRPDSARGASPRPATSRSGAPCATAGTGAGLSPPRPNRARRQPSLRSVPFRVHSGHRMPTDTSDGPATSAGNATIEAREAIARCGRFGSARVALGSAPRPPRRGPGSWPHGAAPVGRASSRSERSRAAGFGPRREPPAGHLEERRARRAFGRTPMQALQVRRFGRSPRDWRANSQD